MTGSHPARHLYACATGRLEPFCHRGVDKGEPLDYVSQNVAWRGKGRNCLTCLKNAQSLLDQLQSALVKLEAKE